MKIFLKHSLEHQKHISSLKTALMFLNEIPVTIYTEYPISIESETVTIHEIDNVNDAIQSESGIGLLAHSSVVFTAEAFMDCLGAYQHFSTQSPSLLQLSFDNEHFQYPSPTILYYGGRRIWSTGNKVTNPTSPVLFGDLAVINSFLNKSAKEKPLFTDSIFHGGNTTILSPLPPLAFDMSKELPVPVSAAAFDAEPYIQSIPDVPDPVEQSCES